MRNCVGVLNREMRGRQLWPRYQEERGRFLEKAAQKRLRLWAGVSETSTAQMNKVFLLLFVHKK
jgi:hypothetical protein